MNTKMFTLSQKFFSSLSTSLPKPKKSPQLPVSASSSAALHALNFDCDGVILESEHLHRQAYNDALFAAPLSPSIEKFDIFCFGTFRKDDEGRAKIIDTHSGSNLILKKKVKNQRC